MELLLPAGVAPADAITFGAAVFAFFAVILVWNGLLARPTGGRRVKELAARREELRRGILAPVRRRKRDNAANLMRGFVQKLHLQRTSRTEAMTLRLARAGWRTGDAMIRYLFFKVALPVVLGILAFMYFHVAGAYDLPALGRIGAVATAIVLGFAMPDLFVRNAINKRREKVRKSLPDALDLMVISAEAGLSLDAMLKRVAGEFGRSGPALADELALTSLELGFLPDRRQALQNLAKRCNQVAVRGLVNSLLQCERYGTPLAQALRVLSNEYREERMLRAEEKAARLPALLTVPMILFILPPLFVVLLGPAVLRTMDAFNNL